MSSHPSDAEYHRAKNDGRDHHFDELDETVAQWLHGRASRWEEISECCTNYDGDQYLQLEAAIEGLSAHVWLSRRLLSSGHELSMVGRISRPKRRNSSKYPADLQAKFPRS